MIPYDQVDKSNWVAFNVDLEDELMDSIRVFAELENRPINDYISKIIYEWWQSELESGNFDKNKYDKIEVKLPKMENNHEFDNPT